MQHLKSIDLPFGKKTRWFATHIDPSSGHIYCQLYEPSISVKYERLYQDITAYSVRDESSDKILNPYIGEFCLSKYVEDDSWYRSQITEVDEGSQQAEVFFIDHGNSEIMQFESIRKLPLQFGELAPQAYECVLANVEPVLVEKWSDKALQLIKELVLEQELDGIPIRLHKNLLVLKLFADKDSTVTVAEQLISAGFGQLKQSSSISASSSVGSLIRSNSVQSVGSTSSKKSNASSSSTHKLVESFTNYPLSKDQYIDFAVVFCEGIHKFFCHPVNSGKDLENLQSALQKFYATNSPSCRKFLKNTPCCAKFSEDGLWYRGLILSHSKDACQVFFADYGNVESVANNQIMNIDPQFSNLPVMAIQCKLSGVAPLKGQTNFTPEANEKFEEIVTSQESIVAFISNNSDMKNVEIVLYEKDDETVNQRLVAEGLAVSTDDHQNKEVQSSSSAASEKKLLNVVKYVTQNIQAGQEEKVFISYAINPHHFYVNLSSMSDSLTQIMLQIGSIYSNTDDSIKLKEPLIVGQPCIAKFSEDGEFYRAEIVEIKNDIVKVHFVDYGNVEEVDKNELRTLRKEFIKLPKQGIRCTLSGVDPIQETFTADVCEKFESIVMEKSLNMEIQAISGGVCTVDITTDDSALMNVSKTLVLSGMVKEGRNPNKKSDYGSKVLSEDAKFKECALDVECYIDVSPVHIESPSQFCCHIVQNAVEFKKMTDELNEFYANMPEDNSISWKKLMPCVALYDEDGCWYRAVVVSIAAKSMEVTFIDFGNSAVVTLKNIRPTFSEFMKLPAQVFVCSLADVDPKEKFWSAEAINSFQNLVLDKHLAAYVKSKNENNSYSVLLYDTKTSEKNISQILIEQNHASQLKKSDVVGCSSYTLPVQEEKVIVTAVNNFGEFWVQLPRLSPQLDQLMEKLYELYSQMNVSDLQMISPMIGQYCCSCFTEDDGWYRACIEEVDGKSLTVKYIDYGNSEHLDANRVKVLNPDFHTPRFALLCCLENHDHLASLTSASEMLLDKEFTAQFKSKDAPFKVELIVDGKPLSQTLMKDVKPTTTTQDEVVATTNGSEEYTRIIKGFSESVEIGKSYQMYFLEATSPSDFYCQPASTEDDLTKLMEDIAVYVSSGKTQQCKGRVGDYVLASYNEDGGWYRACIKENMKQNYKVWYCDYGNQDIIANNQILMLPTQFANLEKQAVLCSLSTVKPISNEWTNGAIEMFNSICSDKTFDVTMVKKQTDKLDVNLVDTSTKDSIADLLIKGNVAMATSSLPEVNQDISYSKPDISSKEVAYCTQVSSATVIKVQLQKYENQLNELMEKLAAEASSCLAFSSNIVGTPCLAVFTEDEQWYRAEVQSVNGRKVTVSFVDYGNTQECEVSSLKQLKPEMAKLPKTCIDCILHDVSADDLDKKKSEEHLKTTLIDQQVMLEIKTPLDNNNSLEGYVYQDGHEDHVNDLLYTLFALEEEAVAVEPIAEEPISEQKPAEIVTKEVVSVKYIAPELSPKEVAYCTQVSSATILKVQLQKYENQLNELMGKLATEASSCLPLSSNIVGTPCLAVFTEDEQWYRAEVQSVNGSKVTVSFVDYGNTQGCEVSSLKQLKPEMAKLPKTCIDCILHDVSADDLDKKKSEEHLKTTLIDQQVMLEIKTPLDNNNSLEGYVYQDGQEDHVNDLLYTLFALEEEAVAVEPIAEEPISEQKPAEIVTKEEVSVKYIAPELSAKEVAYCTQVSSATILKVQLQKYENQLNELMGKLATEASSCLALSSNIVGTPCLAVFTEDEQWYRAEVQSINESKVTVSFVDYGNTQECEVSSLKQLKPEMAKLPKTCIDCILHDVSADDLDKKNSEEHLKTTLIDQQVTLEIKTPLDNNNSLEAYVYQDGQEDHVNDLLYSLFALEEEAVAVEPISEQKPAEIVTKEEVSVKYIAPELSAKEVAYCTQVSSATILKVQLQKYENQLNELMGKLATEASSCLALSSNIVGAPCLAVFTEDEQWYRAEVQSVNGSKVTVSFVDYGNTQECEVSSLKQLKPEMAKLPKTCIDCILHDVSADDLDKKKSEEHLKTTLIDQQVTLEIKTPLDNNNSLEGYVYQDGQEDHVNDLLYSLFALEEEAVAEEPISEQKPETSEQSETATKQEVVDATSPSTVTKFDISYPEIQLEQSYSSVCYVVDNAFSLKCQLTDFQEGIDKLMLWIASNVSQFPQLSDCEVGRVGIAKYEADAGWYRARIVKVNDDKTVRVHFLDFGNTEDIASTDLKEMPQQCSTLPQTCISVTIFDVHADDINTDATKSWLVEQLLQHVVRLQVVSKETEDSVSAYIYLEGRDNHINDQIYELFSLEVEESNTTSTTSMISQPKDVVKVGETVTSVCYVVNTSLELKCQLLNFSNDIEQVMNALSEKASNLPAVEEVSVGMCCAAKYPVDQEWYRVRILEVSTQDVKCDFLDYGSVDMVPRADLRVLPDELKTLPQTCLSVTLNDVHSDDIDKEETQKWLSESFLEKELKLEIKSISELPQVSANVYQTEFQDWKDQHINDHIYELFALPEGSQEDSGISVGGSVSLENAKVEPNATYIVYPTHIQSSTTIKCQLSQHKEASEDMASDFKEYCTNASPLSSLVIGSFCFGKSTKDGGWYRSQVIGTTEGNITLCHVDTGVEDTVSISETRMLDEKFCAFPRLSLDVILHDVHAEDIITNDATTWLAQFNNTPLNMTVVSYENEILEANLFKSGEEVSINDQLYNNFAIADDETPQLHEETIDSVNETSTLSDLISIKDHTQTSVTEISGIEPLEETLTNEQQNESDSNVTSFPKPQLDNFEKVLCTYVGSSNQASFQLLKYESMLNIITELLVEPPNELLKDENIRKGQAVIAQSVDDCNWYRAQVESISPTGVKVLFIDFGNRETVPSANLRDVFDVRFMQPTTCITCKLDKVVNVDEDRCKDWLEENCIDEVFNAEFGEPSEDSRPIVIHFANKEGIACVNEIVLSQFASTKLPASVEIQSTDKIDYVKGTDIKTTQDEHRVKWMVPEDGKYEKVVCTNVNSCNLMTFQLARLSNKLDKMMSKIGSEIDNLSGVRSLVKDSPCIAQFNDLQWYRAKVVEPAEGYATVEFIDYGNIDDVIVEDIRVISAEMLEEPVFGINCHLHGVDIPEENAEDTLEYLNKTLVEDTPEVTLRIVKSDVESRITDIILLQQGQNINEFLQSNYGSMDSVLRDCSVQLFDKVNIAIPPTDRLSHFWCLLDDTKELREGLMDSLMATYSSKEFDTIEDPGIDQPCCVFGKDGKWYRGTVESMIENDLVVFMVDFGFSEVVKKTNIRVLLPDFMKLGVQGFFGSLFDLRPSKNCEDGWSKEAVEYFNNVCKDDVLVATILNCNNQVRSLALTKSNGDTIYELLSNQHFAECNPRNLHGTTPPTE